MTAVTSITLWGLGRCSNRSPTTNTNSNDLAAVISKYDDVTASERIFSLFVSLRLAGGPTKHQDYVGTYTWILFHPKSFSHTTLRTRTNLAYLHCICSLFHHGVAMGSRHVHGADGVCIGHPS